LVDAENYLLTCYRYIELNPVVAGMVNTPEEYRWSSYPCNAWDKYDELVTAHELYLRVATVVDERQRNYRELFRVALSEVDVHQIRQSLHRNYPLGNDRFKAQIELALGEDR